MGSPAPHPIVETGEAHVSNDNFLPRLRVLRPLLLQEDVLRVEVLVHYVSSMEVAHRLQTMHEQPRQRRTGKRSEHDATTTIEQ